MNKRPVIVLVNPPLEWDQVERMDIKPPLNLLYLASFLNARQPESAVLIDVVGEALPLEAVMARLAQYQPRFLGVPFYQASQATGLELCRAARQALPDLITVGGGPMMTTSCQELLSHPELDLGVLGEGEETLLELLETGCERWERIPGLAWKQNQAIINNQERQPISCLDDIPFLDFSLVQTQTYLDFQHRLNMPQWLFLSTSRGCPFRCVFCATPALWPGPVRRLSIPRLFAEMRFHRERFPEAHFGFMDDSFFSDKTWLRAFFEEMRSFGGRYCCIGRADHLEAQDVESLARTGCHYVALGVETGNQERQRRIRKYLDLEKVRQNVALLVKHGIICKCFFMLGFPDESLEEMVETINFAVDCARLGMQECNIFPVSAYPGTELARGLSSTHFKSTVYHGKDRTNRSIDECGDAEARSDKRLSIYGGVPDADLNPLLDRNQLLELTRLAYQKVERRESISLAEVMALQSVRVLP